MDSKRANFILFLIFLFGAGILVKLFFLQVVDHDFYSALARGQQQLFIDSQGDRGDIFLQNHEIAVATDKIYQFCYISPDEIPDGQKEETASKLSEILGLEKEAVAQKAEAPGLYQHLKGKLAEEEIGEIQELDLEGVYIGKEKIRSYPYGELASHVLGFVNRDGQGQYGVEEYQDEVLKGEFGFWEGIKGPLGFIFSGKNESALRGADVFLTLDHNIQYFAESLLEQTSRQLNIREGEIIVMDPETGAILAMAEYPFFNLNSYSEAEDFSIFQNSAAQEIFEPGSIFKPITMAAALEEGEITPYTTYRDPGVIKIGAREIYNYEKRIYPGDITMTEVLEKSINTGAVFAGQRAGKENLVEYIEEFGFFEKTGVEIAGEVHSENREFKKGYEINYATASFGQGIEVTPLQMARAFCAIANGGELMRPYLVKEIKKEDNEAIETEPEALRRVISKDVSSKLTAMLVSVIENGFGKAAKIPGYYIAGKTGTAQIAYSALGVDKEGYSEKTWQSFIGFAPAFEPRFLIMVRLKDPATRTAEYSAVPIFKDLAKYIIDYYKIPPDYEE